ncbi:YheV family putative metal-binding protein [Halomonas getboli]
MTARRPARRHTHRFPGGLMATQKRFIAGAICPRCAEVEWQRIRIA